MSEPAPAPLPVPAGPADVNAAWLERVLRTRAGLEAARVRGVVAVRIGEGFGLDGVVARVTIEGDGAPASVVLKWIERDKAAREAWALGRIAARSPAHVPALLHFEPAAGQDCGVLVLADVRPARQGDVILGATADDVGRVLELAAGWHAATWGAADPEFAFLPAWDATADEVDAAAREALPAFLAQRGDALPAAARCIAERLAQELPAARAALAAAPRALIHRDLHMDNVLFRPDGTPVVLDWTGARPGPVAWDVVHPLVEGLLPDVRRAHGDALFRSYLDALAAAGVREYGIDRLRRDAVSVLVVFLALAVRWTARPETGARALPRGQALRESFVRNVAAALADAVAPDG